MAETINLERVHNNGKAELIVGIRENQFKLSLKNDKIVVTNPVSGERIPIEGATNGGSGGDTCDLIEHDDYPGCYYRVIDGQLEWDNPPLITNVEYRTTERYKGAVVYKKVDVNGNVLWRIESESTWRLLSSSGYVAVTTVE